MKKVILGVGMLISGTIGISGAIIGSILANSNLNINSQLHNSFASLTGITLGVSVLFAILGLIIAFAGAIKEDE